MRTFRFVLTINVDGVLRDAGCEVPESDIPAGCLASLIRLGQVVEVEAKPIPPELPKLAEAKPPELKTAAPKSPAKK